jgi:fibronectin-binding autotransporter adhesin
MKNCTSLPSRRHSALARTLWAGLGLLALLAVSAQAQIVVKANNTANLTLGSSWVGGIAPTSTDTAQWNNTVTGPNTTVLGADTNWAAIAILNPGGPVTINAGNTLTLAAAATDIDMSAATADLTLNCGVTLGAGQTWNAALGRTLTVNGVVGGAFTLTKKGEGILVLNGTNTHNATTVGDGSTKSGAISIGNSSALGAGNTTLSGSGLAAYWLSGGVTVPNALAVNGAAGNGITDYGNLRNLSGNNTWTGLITGNASPRIGCDSGTLEIKTGGFTLGSTSSDRGPNFIGAGDIIVSAPVRKFTSGSRANFLTKSLGTGTLRLSATSTYTGATTLTSGTTMFDYGTVADVVPNGSVLSLQGGALTLSGGSAPELVASTTIGNGSSSVTRRSGTSTLRMNAINRPTSTGTIDFGMPGVAETDTANLNGILGGYATVAASDWAVNSTGGADGPIAAYTAYQTSTTPTSWVPTDNVSLAGNPTLNVPGQTINSLRLTAASTVTVATGSTLTNASGGLLVTGSGATAIVGGDSLSALAGGNGTDLAVHQYSSADCTISAVIANNTSATRLTKSGPGKLILSGANTYTTNTYLNGGVLSISANNNLGDPATGAAIVFNGGTLQATTTFALDNAGANSRRFTMNDFTTSAIDVTGASVLTFSGVWEGRGWLTKIGPGTLRLAAAQTTYQGDVLINGGYVNVAVPETNGVSGPFGNQATGPSVSGVSCFLHFGGGTLQYSSVNNYDYSYRFSPDDNQAYSVDLNGTNVTWASALNSRDGSLAVRDSVGGKTLMLTAVNAYNGPTTIGAGATLALGSSGSISNSSQVNLPAGATLDVSLASSVGLGAGTALSASGTGTTVGTTAAAINGPLAGNVNLGTRPITLAYDGANPALYVSQGTLQVQGNDWTINGSVLSPGTSYAVASQAAGAPGVTGTHTVFGPAVSGMTAIISASSTNVLLTTSPALTPSSTSVGSSANPSTYGTAPTFTATVGAAGATGTVLFVLDGVPQSPAVAVSGGTAAFTPPNSLSAGPHTVVAQYSGDATYGSSVSAPFAQTVSPKALTMSGLSAPASRVYDGTALAYVSGIPVLQAPVAFGAGTPSDGKPYTGDAVGIIGLATGTYNSKDVGTAATVTFGGLSLNGGQAANYALTIQGPAPATITAKPLTVSSPAVASKTYDATIAATLTGSLLAAEAPGTGTAGDGKPFTGDSVTLSLSGTFDNKNAGTGKAVASTSSLGGAQAGDYSLTQPTSLTGTITKSNLTVTAQTNSRIYDGTTNAAAAPTITSGTVQTGDTANFTEAYSNKHAGAGKTLLPLGSVTDGNNGSNYNVTFVSDPTGVITQTNITVTAQTNTKVYDGTITAAALPTVTAGSIQPGDTANFVEAYANKNVGTGKTLIPSGSVADGNGGANYNVAFANDTTGVINVLAVSCLVNGAPNPSGPGTNVTFTAMLNGAPPAADKPTGDVVFTASGVPFSTNALVSGVAAASTASLPLGTNTVQAEYIGDGNFLGSTCSVAQVVKVMVTCGQTNALLGITDNLNGTFTLSFAGTPQAEYYVLRSLNVAAPMTSWLPVAGSTNTVTNLSGLWQFTVTNTSPQTFYRSAAALLCP